MKKQQRLPIRIVKIGNKQLEESDVAIINIFPPTKKLELA